MNRSSNKLLYSYEEAAVLLCLTPVALRNLKHKGRGPKSVKIGRRVFFAHADLIDWIEQLRLTA